MTIETTLSAIAAGDRSAFERLYREMYSSLLAQALAIVSNDTALAEDAVDEAFMDVWCKADSYNGSGSAVGWVRRIVRNKAIDQLRKRPAGETLRAPDMLDVRIDEGPDPELSALEADSEQQVRRSLDCLGRDHREVVVLYYFCGMSLLEIAESTEACEGTVKSRLFHARKTLKSALAETCC